jgi:hypothetical protein
MPYPTILYAVRQMSTLMEVFISVNDLDDYYGQDYSVWLLQPFAQQLCRV